MNLKESVEIYLKWKESHTRVAAQKYRIHLIRFGHFCGEETTIEELSGDSIISFLGWLRQQNYADSTVAYAARILKNYATFWNGRGKIHFSPKEIISPRYVSPQVEIITQEDFISMCDLLSEDVVTTLQQKLILNMLWETGVRVSELMDIQISDLANREHGDVSVIKVRTRKSLKYNHVAWGPETERLLKKYLGLRLCYDHPSDALFVAWTKKTTKSLSTRSVQRIITQLAKEAMIGKEITPHSFRHAKALHLLDQGANVRDIQAILRHVSPISSFHYLGLHEGRFIETAAKYLPRVA